MDKQIVAGRGVDGPQDRIAANTQRRSPWDWRNVPEELKLLRQWALASLMDASPFYINAAGGVQRAKVNDPTTWMTFYDACRHAMRWGMCIGFFFAANDPYACLDVDNKPGHPAPPRILQKIWHTVVHELNTYAEVSPGGNGLHINVRAVVGPGPKKRHPVEIYSEVRFLRFTGWVVHRAPIREAQKFMDDLQAQMQEGDGHQPVESVELVEMEPEWTDDDIFERAATAANSEKFLALWEGNWQELYDGDQSRADKALIGMLAFYSKSNSQCLRMFHQSQLGRRKKAYRKDYFPRTLKKIRSRQAAEELPPIDISDMMRVGQ